MITNRWIAVCPAPLHILVFYSKINLTKLVSNYIPRIFGSCVYVFSRHQKPFKVFQTMIEVGSLVLFLPLLSPQHCFFGSIFLFIYYYLLFLLLKKTYQKLAPLCIFQRNQAYCMSAS